MDEKYEIHEIKHFTLLRVAPGGIKVKLVGTFASRDIAQKFMDELIAADEPVTYESDGAV